MNKKMLFGKHALVTGGTRGIGASIVEILLDAGCRVVFCGRGPAAAVSERLADLEARWPGQSHYVACDISCGKSRQNLLQEALATFGPLDLLINNAGVAPDVRADLLVASEASFDRIIAINLKGPYFLTQAVACSMIADPRPGQCIITIGSISAETASPSRGDYCLAKAGLSMHSKLWAVRLAEYGINVYEIQPGVIKTDMTAVVSEKYDRLLAQGLALQSRWGLPEDVAKAVLALAGGALPYSTGQVIRVDGGMSIQRL